MVGEIIDDSSCADFSKDHFYQLLSISDSFPLTDDYFQIDYIFEYLAAAGCKYILKESSYTDNWDL